MRIGSGSLPFINQVVALMNITSLERLVPCGGGDLRPAGGDLLLRPAIGTESYRPLGRPDVLEHSDPGEIVYVTKLTEASTAVCLNLDFMAPAVPTEEHEPATRALADDLSRRCGCERALTRRSRSRRGNSSGRKGECRPHDGERRLLSPLARGV